MLNYIAAILFAIAVACGGFGYYEHSQVAKLTQDVTTYKDVAATNLKERQDADKACVVTVDSLNTYYKEITNLSSSQESTGDAVNNLPTLTIKEKANAAPTSSQEPKQYADDDKLSPDVMRLLDTAYCYGDKNGCATSAK